MEEKEVSIQGNLEMNKEENYITISVNPKIYPLEFIMSSAYIFLDSCYVLVDGDPQEEIIVEIRPKNNESLEEIGRKFNNELINYANYTIQATKNKNLREAVVNRVLMTNSENQESCPEPNINDPENIAIPWHENEQNKHK